MESSTLFNNPLICLGNFLSDLIQASSFAANLKDAKTGLFRESNLYESKIAGLTPQALTRLDIVDVGKILKLEDALIESVLAYDRKVVMQAVSQNFVQTIVEHSGFVRIGSNLKLPVFDNYKKQKVIAILSYSYDVTAQYDLDFLFESYKNFYPVKQAIFQFLRYLKLDSCFQEMPSHQELVVLLA